MVVHGAHELAAGGYAFTTELTALRRTLTPVVERVSRLWLRMHGYGCRFAVVWDEINLQDEVEEARAALYREQARKQRIENDLQEFGVLTEEEE